MHASKRKMLFHLNLDNLQAGKLPGHFSGNCFTLTRNSLLPLVLKLKDETGMFVKTILG